MSSRFIGGWRRGGRKAWPEGPIAGWWPTYRPLPGAAGDGPLQGRPAPGVKRIRLLVFPVLTHPARPAGGRVESTQLSQALLLGREGGLQGVGKLRVVHGNHPETCFQLEDFDFSSGQF